jgi:hypothetical protein
MIFVGSMVSALLMCTGYYAFFAWIRREHFYHGLPTSYWYLAIKSEEHTGQKSNQGFLLLRDLLLRFGVGGPLLQADDAAIPVLLDLLAERDPYVVQYAADTLVFRTELDRVAFLHSLGLRADEAAAFLLPNNIVIALRRSSQPGPAFAHLIVLLDRRAEILDKIYCEFVFVDSTSVELRKSSPDGGELIVRCSPDRAQSGSDPLERVISHGSDEFHDDSRSADWHDGSCLIQVRNGKLSVLRPQLGRATGGGPKGSPKGGQLP